jgi:hypothetical protein
MNENVEVKRIAFLVGDEVFHIINIPQIPQFAGVYEGMLSGPTLVDITNNDVFVEPGTRLIDGEFYVPVSRITGNEQGPDYEVE